MLGSDVEIELKSALLDFIASDIDVDISDISQLRSFVQGESVSWVINCSAYTAVDLAEDEVEKAFAVNAEGVRNIAIVARELKAKLIHVSTDYVFDGIKFDSYSEDDKANPQSIYGASKLQGEKNIADMFDDYFIVRVAWLYGRFGKNFVYTMLRLFNERDEVKVVSDQYGSPTWSRDAAKAILKMVECDFSAFGVYHYTNEGRISWYDFAVKIYEFGKEYGIVNKDTAVIPITTKEYPTRAKRPINSCLSKQKIQNSLMIEFPEWQDSLRTFLVEIAADKRHDF